MTNPFITFGATFCLTCVGLLALSIQSTVAQMPRLAVETRTALLKEIDLTRSDLIDQVQALRIDSFAEVDSQATALRGELHTAIGLTNRQIADLQTNSFTAINKLSDLSDRRYGDTLALVNDLTNKLDPAITNINAITADAKVTSDILFRRDALPAQVLGVLGGAKVTLGQTASTMRDIQTAMPTFITTWQSVGTHINDATASAALASKATAKTMENFSAASKPLPTFVRIILGVGPPVAQAGAAAVAAGSALGWIK